MTGWVRLWHDMPTDPKWRAIARKSGQPLPCVIALFNLMMVNASENAKDRGTLCGFDEEDAAAALDMEPEAIAAIMAAMQGKVLDGDKLTGWKKRQPAREDERAASRKRRQREREKAEGHGASRNVTQCHAPDTDTDTDADILVPDGTCASGDAPVGNSDEELAGAIPAEPAHVAKVANVAAPDPPEPALKPEHIQELWNEVAHRIGRPAIRSLTPERRATVKARIAQYSIDDFAAVFGKIEASAFLRGETRWPGVTFDWMIKKSNFQKILEGNFDGKPAERLSRPAPGGGEHRPASVVR